MRIIGGHDYYDIGMAQGRDGRIVFVREIDRTLNVEDARKNGIFESCVNLRFEDVSTGECISRNSSTTFRHGGSDYDFCTLSVVLGGKRYGGLRFRRNAYGHPQDRQEVYFWNLGALTSWLGSLGLRAADRQDDRRREDDRTVPLTSYFDPVPLPKRTVDYLTSNRIVVMSFTGEGQFDWVRREHRVFWRVNADSLKGIQFYRALDAYSLFQEIEMWIGGVMAPEARPVISITDDLIKRDKHGFDERSFKRVKRRA